MRDVSSHKFCDSQLYDQSLEFVGGRYSDGINFLYINDLVLLL